MGVLSLDELQRLSERTVAHYEDRADTFWHRTKDHDVLRNIDTLLHCLSCASPHRILDFGCGPGRDLVTFRSLGHEVVGLDGCMTFCSKARELSGAEVWHQDFLDLTLPEDHFCGVFANASLFHVPTQELLRVLEELRATMVQGGVLFSSNPRGLNTEGWNGERYGAYHDLQAWRAYMNRAGFDEIVHFYRPAGLPREQQPWLASAWLSR